MENHESMVGQSQEEKVLQEIEAADSLIAAGCSGTVRSRWGYCHRHRGRQTSWEQNADLSQLRSR